MKDPFVKISRNGEAFWIGDVQKVAEGKFVGLVANNLVSPDNAHLRLGSIIQFSQDEVKDMRTVPKLAIDNEK